MSDAEVTRRDRPDLDVTGSSGGPKGNPKIPCHECGREERFLTMKRSSEWVMEYVDEPYWRAYCPDCKGGRGS